MVTWFYFITFAATAALIGNFIFRNKRVDSEYILFCFMIFFNALGRWLVAASDTVEQAIWANKILYFGGCYTPLLLVIVLARISDIDLPVILKAALTAYSTLVFALVMTTGYSEIYYKSVRLTEGNGYHYLVKEYGPTHSLYPVMMILYIVLLVLLLARAFMKRKSIAFGTVLSVGILGFIVIVTYLLTRIFNSSIEWLSVGYLIAVVIISRMFNQINLYDMSTNIAVAVASANENGFIVFDNKKKYVNSNALIKQLYPEISEWQVDAVPPKFGSFFSDEIIRWFLDKGSTREHKMVRAGGKYYEISVRDITSGRKNKKIGYLMEAADRTAEHNYTMKVEETANIANEANKAKSDFLAMMSHELRTPLNAVIGMNEMILRESNEEAVLAYAENACNAGKTLLSIINNVLDLSKIEAGKLDLVEEEYELSTLIYDCYNLTANRAEAKGLSLTYKTEGNLPSKLFGDIFHIRQIVVNFLTNAVKYTDEGGIELSVSGEHGEDGFELQIRVKDSGIGLTEESMEQLFTNFRRFDLKRNIDIEGTGLGLSICKQLAELMNGVIEVESEYGKGSVFSLIIPQGITDETPIGELSQRNLQVANRNRHRGKIAAKGARILVVDDSDMNLLVFKSLLKGCGFEIDTAQSGQKCLELIKARFYDIIFMDHMMPEMDGIETFRKMRGFGEYPCSSSPVIMLTANAISGLKEKYLGEGFSGYLSKPIDKDKLDEILLEFLGDKVEYSEGIKTDIESEHKLNLKPGIKADECKPDEGKKEREGEAMMNDFEGLLAAFPDMDLKKGLAYCSNSEEFYVELLKDLAAPAKREELQAAYDNRDWELYTIKVHALKGHARTLGLTGLGMVAEGLQKAGENADVSYIEENHREAMGLLDTLSAVLERVG